MASAKKTDNYGLNLWQEGDKPHMKDFNEDNRILDEVLGNKADKILPKKYDLPLKNGFEKLNASEYFVNQENMVSIYFKIGKSSDIPKGMYVIAQLPSEFSPVTYTPHNVMMDAHFTGAIGMVWVRVNGEVVVRLLQDLPFAENQGFAGSITFYAGI